MVDTPDKVGYEDAARTFGVAEVTIREWVRAGASKKYGRPRDRKVYVSIAEIRAWRQSEPRPLGDERGPATERAEAAQP